MRYFTINTYVAVFNFNKSTNLNIIGSIIIFSNISKWSNYIVITKLTIYNVRSINSCIISNNRIFNETIWIKDKNLRKKKYNEIIIKGDHEQIVKLIKTLYLNKQEQIKKGKKFHVQDMYLLDAAEKMLYEEFSYTLDIQPDEVLPFILKNIKLNEKGNNNV